MPEQDFAPFIESFTRVDVNGRRVEIEGDPNHKLKVFDLIRIDFAREHPVPGLVNMVFCNPGELVVRTNPEAAEIITNYVNEHLQVCEVNCRDFVPRIFKTY
ncbi:hypothetical protein HY024_02785 [Candidatus Curtissbacteria bacterium]|nr:hypothetical protein [Candidatus Curtissbacteria bacterium]